MEKNHERLIYNIFHHIPCNLIALNSKIINELLETLPDREKKTIELRFGLNGNEIHTLEETGKKLLNLHHPEKALSAGRVRQIEAKALRRLQHPTRARKLIEESQKKQGKEETAVEKNNYKTEFNFKFFENEDEDNGGYVYDICFYEQELLVKIKQTNNYKDINEIIFSIPDTIILVDVLKSIINIHQHSGQKDD